MNVKCIPVPGARTAPLVLSGRVFQPSAVYDLAQDDDAANVLGCNGWVMMPPHGPTTARPATAPVGVGSIAFVDDDLGKTIYAQCWPEGSGKIVGWADANGIAV